MDLRAKIISQETFSEELKNKKEHKELKTRKADCIPVAKPKTKKQKINEKKISFSESESETSDCLSNLSEDEELADDHVSQIACSSKTVSNGHTNDVKSTLWKTWDTIFPPVEEQDLKGKWYAICYAGRKIAHLFIARVTKRFRFDEGGPVEAIECLCLKEKFGTGDTILEEDSAAKPEMIPIHDVIMGPLTCHVIGKKRWDVPEYVTVKRFFDNFVSNKYNRQQCKDDYVCEKYKDC